jgi:hypothetical protein
MQHKLTLYWQLLHNEERLIALQHSGSIDDFVQQMAQYLEWPDLNLDLMQSFLQQQNGSVLAPELELFSRFWQPADYRKKDQALTWVPAFEPLKQPFYQEDMLMHKARLLAVFIRPVTLVKDLLPQNNSLTDLCPDLIIFHWSRCGSTLLGGLYRQLSAVKLLSESMLISDMLLDPFWSEEIKPQLLKLAVRLQGRLRHGETHLVLKLNAWDLQQWPLWLQQFPDARILCLGRQPEAILASHQRMPGLHMVAVKGVWQRGNPSHLSVSPLLGRIAVLRLLMCYTEELLDTGRADFLDYLQLKQLLQQSPQQLVNLLSREITGDEQQRWLDFSLRDAKQPELVFQASQSPQQTFTSEELQQIHHELSLAYQALLLRS